MVADAPLTPTVPVSPDDAARAVALALPGATEQDHHGRPSFRVGGRILATLWAPGRMNVMLDPEDVRAAEAEHPDCCSTFRWGRAVRAVQVDLAAAGPEVVEALLHRAFERGAPRRRGNVPAPD